MRRVPFSSARSMLCALTLLLAACGGSVDEEPGVPGNDIENVAPTAAPEPAQPSAPEAQTLAPDPIAASQLEVKRCTPVVMSKDCCELGGSCSTGNACRACGGCWTCSILWGCSCGTR